MLSCFVVVTGARKLVPRVLTDGRQRCLRVSKAMLLEAVEIQARCQHDSFWGKGDVF